MNWESGPLVVFARGADGDVCRGKPIRYESVPFKFTAPVAGKLGVENRKHELWEVDADAGETIVFFEGARGELHITDESMWTCMRGGELCEVRDQ